jgi:hypothetical protein
MPCPARRPLLLECGTRISPRIGGSCESGRVSRISGRKSASDSRYRVFTGLTRAEGAVHIGLGETIRKNKWGATESTSSPS